MTAHDDAERLERHLLGRLPEEESARLEERLLAEDDLFELAEAVEADLVAAHARGELEGADAEAAARLAASPRGRRAALLARDLARAAAEEGRVLPFRARAARALRRPAVRVALAAGLLAAVGTAGWLAVERRAVREERAVLETERRELLGRERALRRLPRRERGPILERVRPEEPPERRAVEATLLLALATLRSEGDLPRLVLPADVAWVRLEVDLGEAGAGYAAYRAALRDAAGAEVWSGEAAAPAAGGALRLEVPAGALAPGRYELAVTGIGAGGAVEELGYPEFEVQRPKP